MKKAFVGIFLIVFLAIWATASRVAFAGNGSPADDPARAGLWQDGQAVFSDIQLLDVFWGKYARGYQPTQPVNFSHQIHVEKNQMECQYCHSGVAKSPFATVPSLKLCMGCHENVKTESPEIQKLKTAWDAGKPIEWEPVNNLPEHVNFTHERHVKAGVGCHNCHGQIQKMPVVEKLASFKMGFCITCHRENGASIDCGVCHY
jgi:hypothetical protein